jgi:arginase
VYQQTFQSLTEGALPIVIGGDHSLAAGSVGASADFAAERGGQIGVLWIDAHGDMNTPATTSSGNVHGMPLAALVGTEPAELARLGRRAPKVKAEHVVLIGIRNRACTSHSTWTCAIRRLRRAWARRSRAASTIARRTW